MNLPLKGMISIIVALYQVSVLLTGLMYPLVYLVDKYDTWVVYLHIFVIESVNCKHAVSVASGTVILRDRKERVSLYLPFCPCHWSGMCSYIVWSFARPGYNCLFPCHIYCVYCLVYYDDCGLNRNCISCFFRRACWQVSYQI